MMPSEFIENASLYSLVLWFCTKTVLEHVFSIKTRNITYQNLQMQTILKQLPLPIRIPIRTQLGLSDLPQNTKKPFKRTRLIFIKFPPHKTSYPPFQIATLHKKTRKMNRQFRYLPSLIYGLCVRIFTHWSSFFMNCRRPQLVSFLMRLQHSTHNLRIRTKHW